LALSGNGADESDAASRAMPSHGCDLGNSVPGANSLRANAPTPANCDGVTAPCNYGAGQIGEQEANLPLLLQKERGNTTPFAVEPQGASMYVNGRPAPDDAALRQLQRDTAILNANNPYSGATGETIANYQAGDQEDPGPGRVRRRPAQP
jgi:hypothetical protein